MGMKNKGRSKQSLPPHVVWGGIGCMAVVALVLASRGGGEHGDVLSTLTWNVAAINNNPFEYWITHNAAYNKLMEDVQHFIAEPGENDVPVSAVFTDEMFAELKASMAAVGWTGLEEVESRWRSEYKGRRIISEFMKDPLLGKKRLASMPDRVTNTINTFALDGSGTTTMRPTVINCYEGDLSSQAAWWAAWRTFVFNTPLAVTDKTGALVTKHVYEMFGPIKKSKYPAISEEEEAISVPLQTLAGGIFDAILVHMMNSVTVGGAWQPLRSDMCEKLNRRKNDRTVEILETTYRGTDVVFLQEVANAFKASVQARQLGAEYHVLSPAENDPNRDQNSMILLRKARFPDPSGFAEVTGNVFSGFGGATDANGKAVPIANGDLYAVAATDGSGERFVFCSFHGDTNGLATIPVVSAVDAYIRRPDSGLAGHRFIFGLDANTYERANADQQDVNEFQTDAVKKGMVSQRGSGMHVDASDYTTFNARTYLQPQLNKAIPFDEKDTNPMVDRNPKDFILWYGDQASLVSTSKDNTGDRKYVEGMVFPTLAFPSDHGITTANLRLTEK